MVWSVFNYLLTQKLARKAKVALGCSQYKELLKTLKVAQKLPSTIDLCLVVNLVLYLFYFLKIILLFIHYVPPNRNLDYYFVIFVVLQKFGLLDY